MLFSEVLLKGVIVVRVNTSINHKSRFCVILVFAGFAGFAALLLGAMPVHAQQGLLNRTLVPADSSQNGLISDIVDDRAIKQLISSKAELLLPDPEVSLLEGFEEQIKRSETKLKLNSALETSLTKFGKMSINFDDL